MRLLLIGMLVGGCAEQVEQAPEIEESVPYWGPSGIYEEDGQCRDLLGGAPDSLTDREAGDPYLSFPLQTTGGQTVTIANGTLSAQGGILHKELRGTNGVIVQVTAVGSDAFGATYTLQYRTSTDPTMRDYCAPGEVASALLGEWSSTAFRVLPSNRIAFACGDAAVKKCYGFGYVPDNNPTSTETRAHQACTRMARADICGDGRPGTRKLTPIVIRDLLPGFNPSPTPPSGSNIPPLRHAPYPAPPDQHFYESAWSWRENVGAVCMERDRWASVGPLSCPNLVDPHVDASARFCEELGDDAIFNLDGILVNASKTQDRYIGLWRNPTTGDTVSTIRGFWREDHGDPIPFTGYTEFLGNDGILLRNPPYSLTTKDVVPVYSIKVSAGDRALLTSTDPLLTPSHPYFEGYLLQPRDGVIPFARYTRTKLDGTTDTVTSIGLSAPWTFGGFLENVLAAPAQEIEPLP